MLALLLQALLPYAINQLGSIMYYYLLSSQGEHLQAFRTKVGSGTNDCDCYLSKSTTVADAAASCVAAFVLFTDMSVAVPLCNSLALVCTTVTAAAIGEHVAKPTYVVLGIGFILAGECVYSVFFACMLRKLCLTICTTIHVRDIYCTSTHMHHV
jgi:hypothetical protein